MTDLNGKIAAVTGAAMGMGRLTARKFAADGAKLALVDIRKDDLDAAVAEIAAAGGVAKAYLCDLTKRDEIYATFREIEKDLGPVDVLFNNAGVVFGGPLLETDDDKLAATIAINLTAHIWTMKAVLPGMIAKRAGHIVNFGSAAGILPVPYMVTYCASKAGVLSLTEATRLEMRELHQAGIQFTVLAPSYIKTGMFEGVRPLPFAPWLTPETMVEKIYHAVRHNQYMVRAPWTVNIVPVLKALLPQRAWDYVSNAPALRKSMKRWTGRKLPNGPAAGA